MTIKKTLESFDERFLSFRDPDIVDGFAKDEIKDFIKEAIIQALEEITPERMTIQKGDSRGYIEFAEGHNNCREELEYNKTKFLNN